MSSIDRINNNERIYSRPKKTQLIQAIKSKEEESTKDQQNDNQTKQQQQQQQQQQKKEAHSSKDSGKIIDLTA